jgi:hypothetical protein
VNLNVAWKDFSQVLEQLRSVTILGVDQQVIRIRQRLAWPGIDRVWPQDDFGLVGWPTMDISCGGLFHRVHQPAILRAVGCIGLSVVAKFLRCSLLEIPDQILAKLRRKPLTCIGGATEASEPAVLLREAGPSERTYDETGGC